MIQSHIVKEHEYIKDLIGKRDMINVQKSINSQKMQSFKISMSFNNKVNKLIKLCNTENKNELNINTFNSARDRVQTLKNESKKRDYDLKCYISQERDRKKNEYIKAKNELAQSFQRAKLNQKTINFNKYQNIKNSQDQNLR